VRCSVFRPAAGSAASGGASTSTFALPDSSSTDFAALAALLLTTTPISTPAMSVPHPAPVKQAPEYHNVLIIGGASPWPR
jgi:hypothetical protein